MSMYFHKNIRYLRRINNLSQNAMAELLGYKSFTTIQKWECGESKPTFDMLVNIAEQFQVDLHDLIYQDLETSEYALLQTAGKNKVAVYEETESGISFTHVAGYTEAPYFSSDASEAFAVKIHSEAMSPEYLKEDIVIFERTNSCKNGSSCIVRVSNETIFRKVRKKEGSVILQPINPGYEPVCLEEPFVEIIGIARELRRKVN